MKFKLLIFVSVFPFVSYAASNVRIFADLRFPNGVTSPVTYKINAIGPTGLGVVGSGEYLLTTHWQIGAQTYTIPNVYIFDCGAVFVDSDEASGSVVTVPDGTVLDIYFRYNCMGYVPPPPDVSQFSSQYREIRKIDLYVYSGANNDLVWDWHESYSYRQGPITLSSGYGHVWNYFGDPSGETFSQKIYINGAVDPDDPIGLPPVIGDPSSPPNIDIPDVPINPFPGGDEVPYVPPEYDPVIPDPVAPYEPPSTPDLPVNPTPDTPAPDQDYVEDTPTPIDLDGTSAMSWIVQLQLQMMQLSQRITDIAGGNGDDGSGTTNSASGGNVFIKGLDNQVYGNLYDVTSTGVEYALQNRELSSAEIALKINDVLQANGINSQQTKIVVQAALNDQGMSDYKIGLAFQDALYQSGNWGGDSREYMAAALSDQGLSAINIAEQIKDALASLGLSTDGMEAALIAGLENGDLSAHNIQVAFESALVNKGMNAQNMANATENALANRNLSSAQIGREVGNQISGLGLSTKSNDDANTDRIIAAVGGIQIPTNDNSSVVGAVNDLNQTIEDLYAGELSETSMDPIPSELEFDTFDTNSIVGDVNGYMAQTDLMIIGFETFVKDAFVFQQPSIDRASSLSIDFASWGGGIGDFDIPVYNLDLSIDPIVKFRAFEVFCLYLGAMFMAAKIVRDALMGC